MKKIVIIATLAAFIVPAALAAPPDKGKPDASGTSTPSAAQLCKQQRNTIGMQAFRDLYAPNGSPKAAMDACLKKQVQVASTAAKNAAKECKAEQADANFATAHGGKTFAQFYGTNDNDKNAFGKCVSSKTKEDVSSEQSDTVGAAAKCKAMRANQKADFEKAYGTKKNAFGKCVSALSKEQDD